MNRDIPSQLTLSEVEEQTDKTVTLFVKRDLSYENAAEVIAAVASALIAQPCGIILDMSKVNLIDSSGLRALLQSRKLCEETNAQFSLHSISRPVERVIAMSGFAAIFGLQQVDQNNIYDNAEDTISNESETWNVREYQSVSDPSMVSVLRGRVMDAAADAGAVGDVFCDIQIAVGEALTNAYRHGSPNKGIDKIKLRCMTCSRAIVIEIEDEGQPFDPDAVREPDPSYLRDHGMGIFLMRRAMDVVEFRTSCPGNRVRMIKWLSY